MFLDNAVLFNVPKIPDDRGNLSFFQYPDHISFEIKKVYWINDIPGGTDIPGLANKVAHEVVIALSGCFDVLVSDGKQQKKFTLNRPDICLYIPNMLWRQFVGFSTNSVAFVASDATPEEVDCILDFSQFQSVRQNA